MPTRRRPPMLPDIRHVSLAELLSHPEPFHMARYQRHYEWSQKEMQQLLEDFAEIYEAHVDDPASEPYHFLGNIILYPNPAGGLEVVDGQQRLASLTILIAAARDITANPGARQELTRLLLTTKPDNSRLPRLKLHRGDDEFMERVIIKGTTTAALSGLGEQLQPAAECLRANALIARRWLAERQLGEIIPFMRFILAQSRFVEMLVAREEDAFRIFETTNSRGRPLSNEDVLRYSLVEYATPDQKLRDEYLARWDEFESELGPRGMRRFIGGWRTRLSKGMRRPRALHSIVIESFKTPADARAFLDAEFSTDLATFKQIEAADVALPDGPMKRRIDTILRSLDLVDFDDWLPVATELIGKGLGQPQRLVADLASLEQLAWFYYVSRDDKGSYKDRRKRFDVLMKTVTETGSLAALPAAARFSEDERDRLRGVVQGRIEPKWVPLRSLLVRLELALSRGGRVLARDSHTVEHVLPLRPNAKAWLVLYDNDTRTATDYAQRLGNLCLVSEDLNSRLGNRVYSAKRKMMINDGIVERSALAADVAGEEEWTRAVIDRRSQRFAKVFCDALDISPVSR